MSLAPRQASTQAKPAPVQGRKPASDTLGDPLARSGIGAPAVQAKPDAANGNPAPKKEIEKPKEGGLTFDAEGAEGGYFHSRTAHWPGGSSGVTIGRGYDMGQRSAKSIIADMTLAGITVDDATKFSGAAGKTGKDAKAWLVEKGKSLPEISPKQQVALFDIAYKRLAKDVERISDAYAKTVAKRDGKDEDDLKIDWGALHPAIKDMLVDLRYRGDYTPATRKFVQPLAIANDLKGLSDVMNNKGLWGSVPKDRFERRARFMREAVAGKPKVILQENGPVKEQVPGDAPAGAIKAGVAGAVGAAGQKAPPLDVSVAGKEFGVTADVLNVRSAPDAGSKKLGTLAKGNKVVAKGQAAGWLKIQFGPVEGWVSQQFVVLGAPPAPVKKAAEPKPVTPPAGSTLSGPSWPSIATSRGWYNSTDFDKLAPSFGPSAKKFVEGLRKNGASVTMVAGLRHKKRAVLMHFAWHVAKGTKTPEAANAYCANEGITDIQWVHGDLKASQSAAQRMADAFGLVHAASLTSNHMSGEAIDIKISGVPASLTIDGKKYDAGPKKTGTMEEDKVDHIGKELGVIWYGAGDWVHWSKTGG